MPDQAINNGLVEHTARIVVASVSNNQVEVKDLASLIAEVHSALGRVAR